MSEMVERVARAMLDALARQEEVYLGEQDPIPMDLDSRVIDGSVDLLSVARAAIEALREPSEAMRESGASELGTYSSEWASFEDGAARIYGAMIDKALEDQ